MRVLALSTAAVIVCAAVAVAAPSTAGAASSQVVFAFTGGNQTWVVPDGITAVSITMVGAGGAGGNVGVAGGGGGSVTGVLAVRPGDTMTIIVGQGGINDGITVGTGTNNYRYGGGGNGNGSATFRPTWGSGGGRSAIRSSNALYGTSGDVITAGAGGGGGFTGVGGAGGGSTGADGGAGGGTASIAGGGTQSSGGVGGTGSDGQSGTAGVAYGGGYALLSGTGANEGGGGGGGYWGGGGAGDNGGGGGGSSFVGSPSYFTGSTSAGSGRSAGLSSLPTDCGINPGRGGAGGGGDLGGDGCVVIDYNISSPEGAPPPWLQAYGRPTYTSPCDDGWNPSWAEWPGEGRGGYTCERRAQYTTGGWVYLNGFPN